MLTHFAWLTRFVVEIHLPLRRCLAHHIGVHLFRLEDTRQNKSRIGWRKQRQGVIS